MKTEGDMSMGYRENHLVEIAAYVHNMEEFFVKFPPCENCLVRSMCVCVDKNVKHIRARRGSVRVIYADEDTNRSPNLIRVAVNPCNEVIKIS